MVLGRLRKIYYIFLFVSLSAVIASYSNIAEGGAVLWIGQNVFYIVIALISVSLFYLVISSRSELFSWLETFTVGAFSVSLFLLIWAGEGPFPFGLDSIISIRSVEYILQNGFSTAQIDPGFLIKATYALPMQSTLGVVLALVTNSSYVTAAKYLTLILMVGFLIIYYALIAEKFGKNSALLSLVVIASFPVLQISGSVFNNNDLGFVFIVLALLTILKRDDKNRLTFTVLAVLAICGFVLVHHLTIVLFIAALTTLALANALYRKRFPDLTLRNRELNALILVAVLSVVTYYVFVYFDPISQLLRPLVQQIGSEIAPVSAATTWSAPIVVQRFTYVVFLALTGVLSWRALRTNRDNFVLRYADFLILGGVFLILAVSGAFVRVPFSWDRTSTFGWLFLVPVTLAMLLEWGLSKGISKRKAISAFSAIVIAALVFGNIYALPINIVNRSGTNEYAEVKQVLLPQESDSVLWVLQHKTPQIVVIGDEVVDRIYSAASPSFSGYVTTIQSFNDTIVNSSLVVLRNENYFQIVSYQNASGITHVEGLYAGVLGSNDRDRIFDNAEVRIMYKA